MRIFLSFLAFLLCAISIPAGAENLRVGIPLPLSGEMQVYGEEARNGYLAAKEFLQAKDLELFFEDDRCEPQRAVTTAQKLLNLDHVKVITGVQCNVVLFPAAPLYNRAGVSVITIGGTTGDVKDVGPRIFRMFPADQMSIDPLMAVASERHQRMCVFTVTDAFTELLQRAIKGYFASRPQESLFAEEVDGSAKDYRSALLRLSRRGCDAYMLNATGDDTFIAMLRQMKELGIEGALYAAYIPSSVNVRKVLGAALDGITYADLPVWQEVATGSGRNFMQFYESKFGKPKIGQPTALLAFEALRLIHQAHQAGRPVHEFIRRGERIVDGAMQPYFFDSDGALQGVNFKILKYAGGVDTPVGK